MDRLYRNVKGMSASGEEKKVIVRVYGTEEELEAELESLKEEFPNGIFTPGQPMTIHGVFTPQPEKGIVCIDIILLDGDKKDEYIHCRSKFNGSNRRTSDNGSSDDN